MNVAARPRLCYLLSNGAFCEGAYRALFTLELKKSRWAKEMKMLLRCHHTLRTSAHIARRTRHHRVRQDAPVAERLAVLPRRAGSAGHVLRRSPSQPANPKAGEHRSGFRR